MPQIFWIVRYLVRVSWLRMRRRIINGYGSFCYKCSSIAEGERIYVKQQQLLREGLTWDEVMLADYLESNRG